MHPGPVAGAGGGRPAWWSPATDYVAQQHAAWHAFNHVVRPRLPRLRCIFALLAGLAPLQAERTAERSGSSYDAALADRLCFYDTSSYGPRAVRAMATAVGIGQPSMAATTRWPRRALIPSEEAFGAGYAGVVRRESAARALGHAWVPA